MKFSPKIKEKDIATDEKAVTTNWIFANQFLNPVAIHPSILIQQEKKKTFNWGKKKSLTYQKNLQIYQTQQPFTPQNKLNRKKFFFFFPIKYICTWNDRVEPINDFSAGLEPVVCVNKPIRKTQSVVIRHMPQTLLFSNHRQIRLVISSLKIIVHLSPPFIARHVHLLPAHIRRWWRRRRRRFSHHHHPLHDQKPSKQNQKLWTLFSLLLSWWRGLFEWKFVERERKNLLLGFRD